MQGARTGSTIWENVAVRRGPETPQNPRGLAFRRELLRVHGIVDEEEGGVTRRGKSTTYRSRPLGRRERRKYEERNPKRATVTGGVVLDIWSGGAETAAWGVGWGNEDTYARIRAGHAAAGASFGVNLFNWDCRDKSATIGLYGTAGAEVSALRVDGQWTQAGGQDSFYQVAASGNVKVLTAGVGGTALLGCKDGAYGGEVGGKAQAMIVSAEGKQGAGAGVPKDVPAVGGMGADAEVGGHVGIGVEAAGTASAKWKNGKVDFSTKASLGLGICAGVDFNLTLDVMPSDQAVSKTKKKTESAAKKVSSKVSSGAKKVRKALKKIWPW
jgi:hypothetical protein